MKKKISRIVFQGLLLGLLILVSASPVSAATQKAKAMKAYREFLSQKKIALSVMFGEDNASAKFPAAKMKFALIYLDRNSIPELVIDNSANNTGNFYSPFGSAIFAWEDGEVKQLFILDTNYKIRKYYKKKGVLTLANQARSSLTVTARIRDEEDTVIAVKDKTKYYGPDYFTGKSKKISKAAYRKLLKSAVGKTKSKKITYRDNTEANRKKYLKK